MSFAVPADAYDRYMGRFSRPLAGPFAEWAGVAPGMRVLDVGAGTGALTGELIERLGRTAVAAIEPSPSFAAALTQRHQVPVVLGTAEQLPVAEASFDLILAQLVVHFMADPVRGLAELARATRPTGWVAACVWQTGGHGPVDDFWAAARAVDAEVQDESARPGVAPGELRGLFAAAGMTGLEETSLTVSVRHASFAAWWAPFEEGAGPGGAYLAARPAEVRRAIRGQARVALPGGPFTTTASAWAVKGHPPVR